MQELSISHLHVKTDMRSQDGVGNYSVVGSRLNRQQRLLTPWRALFSKQTLSYSQHWGWFGQMESMKQGILMGNDIVIHSQNALIDILRTKFTVIQKKDELLHSLLQLFIGSHIQRNGRNGRQVCVNCQLNGSRKVILCRFTWMFMQDWLEVVWMRAFLKRVWLSRYWWTQICSSLRTTL